MIGIPGTTEGHSAEIVLAAINARYSHTSFGSRYLLANLGDLAKRTSLLEFDIKNEPRSMADAIMRRHPRLVGFGIYIWNVLPALETIRILKEEQPDLIIVIGGPEVSHEIDRQDICDLADHVITGEADTAFADTCRRLLSGNSVEKIIHSPPPDTETLALPYHLYTDEDVRNRVIYVEASRGCPFTCEFCLSSLDQHLNRFPLDKLLPAFETLISRGVREFKFVDRTFNLSIPFSLRILEFFLERYRPGMFLHFEMIPDRLPEPLREILRCFPRGSLQFEVGIQTFDPRVARLISRRQDVDRTIDNIRWLLTETGSHIHADLIVGLPGETPDGFADGFDRLVALGPQEIQVNLLKRLRGTPLIRHEAAFDLRFSTTPPYEILSTAAIPADTMQDLQRFGRFWDLYVNRGDFVRTAPLLWRDQPTCFHAFMNFSRYVFEQEGRTHGIDLDRRANHLFHYLVGHHGMEAPAVARSIAGDYQTSRRSTLPPFLREADPSLPAFQPVESLDAGRWKRQARHR